jgi:hypothetical protein
MRHRGVLSVTVLLLKKMSYLIESLQKNFPSNESYGENTLRLLAASHWFDIPEKPVFDDFQS